MVLCRLPINYHGLVWIKWKIKWNYISAYWFSVWLYRVITFHRLGTVYSDFLTNWTDTCICVYLISMLGILAFYRENERHSPAGYLCYATRILYEIWKRFWIFTNSWRLGEFNDTEQANVEKFFPNYLTFLAPNKIINWGLLMIKMAPGRPELCLEQRRPTPKCHFEHQKTLADITLPKVRCPSGWLTTNKNLLSHFIEW